MSYQSIEAGLRDRFFTVVNRGNGTGITSGSINYFLKSKSGDNSGKWWDDESEDWSDVPVANPMTHEVDGHWGIQLASSPFVVNVRYFEYVVDVAGWHVPDSRHLICEASLYGRGSEPATVNVSDGINPVQGVEVWITTDSAGLNLIAGTIYTDASGNVEFRLDPGTYYAWFNKAGFNTFSSRIITVPSP